MPAKAREQEKIKIQPPNFMALNVKLHGTAPLVIHRFDEKARAALRPTMKVRADERKARLNRTDETNVKEAEDIFNRARYRSAEGWDGISAGAFRNAFVDACRLTGLQMTRARMAFFIHHDGLDARDSTPLLRIYGSPEMYESVGRTSGMNQGPVLQFRPMYNPWSVDLRMQFDADLLDQDSVMNLIFRAGLQIGVGEGRPFSKKSNGLGFGLFAPEEAK